MSAADARIIADVLLASLIAPVVRLIAMKAFVEPAAAWAGRSGWRFLDSILNDRLPDLPP
jgi:hypothetical protein